MKIMVTGATGNVGREVVNLLLDQGEMVLAITRNPATSRLPAGAHKVAGDPHHPMLTPSPALLWSWVEACCGITRNNNHPLRIEDSRERKEEL